MTDASWLNDLPDAEPRTEIVGRVPQKLARERLAEIQSELLAENLDILTHVAHFADISPMRRNEAGELEKTPIPQAWIDALGQEGAERRYRIVCAAWMNAKEAPVALAISKSLVVGVTKAMAVQQQGPRVMNVSVVNMTAPLPTFKERDMTKELERK